MFNVILTFWLKLKKIIRSPETLSCYLQNSNSKWSFEIVFSYSMPLKTFRLVIFPYLKIPVLSTPSFTFIWLMISHLELSCLLILKIPVLETHWNKNKKQADSKNLCPLLMEKEEHVQIIGCLGGGGFKKGGQGHRELWYKTPKLFEKLLEMKVTHKTVWIW